MSVKEKQPQTPTFETEIQTTMNTQGIPEPLTRDFIEISLLHAGRMINRLTGYSQYAALYDYFSPEYQQAVENENSLIRRLRQGMESTETGRTFLHEHSIPADTIPVPILVFESGEIDPILTTQITTDDGLEETRQWYVDQIGNVTKQ